jgi:DNA-directed RNA polymerase specialized sigma24 family protein
MAYASNSKPHRTGYAVEGLLSRVLSLPSSDLSHFLDKLVGRPEVTASGWRVSERRLSPCPNAKRDAVMAALHDGGLSYADIAHIFNLKPRTVARACQRFRQQKGDADSLSPS